MNTFLIRTPGVDLVQFNNVLNLLRGFPGPVSFFSNEEENIASEITEVTWDDEETFNRPLESINVSYCPEESFHVDYEPYRFPRVEKQLTWEDLFEVCLEFRHRNGISENDYVVLLTDLGNDKNWFGGIDESMRNIFVQTAHWSHFFGSHVDERFPITYEVTAWLLRTQMFKTREELSNAMHREAIGCMMDFCKSKKDIVLKMRTADLCIDCLDFLENGVVSRPIIQQFFETMDGIRRNLMFRERSAFLKRPSSIEINGYNCRILLSDLGNLEVSLNPKEKTLFIFFLRHENGVKLPELVDHLPEIRSLYCRFSRLSDQQRIEDAVQRLVDVLDDNQQQVLSRIRKKFRDLVGQSMAEYYTVEVETGTYTIALDRKFVTYT
jgi:hypothetical protein